ncbi:hypothetical protein JCM10207_003413 [Rhodosporidiobolus poonsookiae]
MGETPAPTKGAVAALAPPKTRSARSPIIYMATSPLRPPRSPLSPPLPVTLPTPAPSAAPHLRRLVRPLPGQASFRDRVAPFIQGPAASVGMANQRRERFGPGHIAAGAASATLAGPSRQAYAFTPDENAPGPNEPGPSQPLRRRPSRQRLRPRTSYEVVSGQGVHRVPRQRRESTSSDDDLYD